MKHDGFSRKIQNTLSNLIILKHGFDFVTLCSSSITHNVMTLQCCKPLYLTPVPSPLITHLADPKLLLERTSTSHAFYC